MALDYQPVDMPVAFSQADAEWIKQQLLSLTAAARQKAI